LTVSAARSLRPVWEGAVLDFLSVRGRGRFTNWTPASLSDLTRELSGKDWDAVLAAQVLSNPAFGADLRRARFLAPREMTRSVDHVPQPLRGRLRGKPDMRATLRLRQRRGDETLWLVNKPLRRWQTADNAALGGWLTYLREAASAVLGSEGDGAPGQMRENDRLVALLLKTEPMRHVIPDPFWAAHEISPRLRAQSDFYRLLWNYARAWRASASARDPQAVRDALRGGWLAAEDDDEMFELYVLSRLVEVLFRFGPWDTFETTPALLGGDPLLRAVRDDVEIAVRFDRAPATVGAYRWIFRRYDGVDAASRRPDIQISISVGGITRHSILEVKATSPATAYGRDSLYKVLGYLKDYAELWPPSDSVSHPSGILVYATGVSTSTPLSERLSDEVLLSTHASLERDLDRLIVRMLGVE
jgi:hypothetical protein